MKSKQNRPEVVPRVATPWLGGIEEAAAYARMGQGEMRRLVKSGAVLSRLKPQRADGTRPVGTLIYAPSIDELLMDQPSAAAPLAQAVGAVA